MKSNFCYNYQILRFFLPFLALATFVTACGQGEKISEKNYIFYVDSNDYLIEEAFDKMVDRFNQEIGVKALSITKDPSLANSSITFIEGLENRDGKVGYGRYIRETQREGNFTMNPLTRNKYSIDAQFDLAYVKERATPNLVVDLQMDLFKLFCHEIPGHGFEEGHSTDEFNLMFPNISGKKNMEEFMQTAKNYIFNT